MEYQKNTDSNPERRAQTLQTDLHYSIHFSFPWLVPGLTNSAPYPHYEQSVERKTD
ncbi:hypothetical protein Pan241w_37650 [Gimesia alba]|uniref:Uncharacterized protein n=1 Tax=Gimesia alba TaxID=2527973 RepID=A0A517RII0_9PLAN|nr:hypothetical protein Pan241w_37650 [Gimesia alba]